MMMVKFKLDDGSECLAEDFIDGYLINPLLLRGSIPATPFIFRTEHVLSVHCIIGAGLRCWGVFDTLEEALACANNGSAARHEPCAYPLRKSGGCLSGSSARS